MDEQIETPEEIYMSNANLDDELGDEFEIEAFNQGEKEKAAKQLMDVDGNLGTRSWSNISTQNNIKTQDQNAQLAANGETEVYIDYVFNCKIYWGINHDCKFDSNAGYLEKIYLYFFSLRHLSNSSAQVRT